MNSDREAAIREGIEVFVHGYCFGRSLTFPHLASQVEGVWWLRDAERKNPADYRKEEWVTFGVEPSEVDRIARHYTRGRYFVCAMSPLLVKDEQLCGQYKQLGYRLLTTEPLFVHSLARIPKVAAREPIGGAFRIEQVQDEALAERFAEASGTKVIEPQYWETPAPFRQYVAIDDEQIVGWVRSVRVGANAWVANMNVIEAFRRRGIGTALLARLLRDDRKRGVRKSVLLATHTGAMLYPNLGYRAIGVLYIFAPPKSD